MYKCTEQRRKIRFPVPEAAYRGNWEIIKRIFDRNLMHFNFTNTWTFPSPPPPYIVHRNRHNSFDDKLDLLT